MLKRIIQHFVARVLTAGLSFGIVWLTARFLGAAGRGAVSLFVTDVAALLLFIGLVGGSSLILLAPHRRVWHLLRPAYAWALAVSLIGPAVVGLLRPGPSAYLLHLGAVTLVQALFSINTFLLLGRQRERAYNVLMVVQVALLAGALGLAFGPLEWRAVPVYYYACYLAYGLPLLASLVLLARLPDARSAALPRPAPAARPGGYARARRRATARELARHSRGAHLSNILAFANYRLSYYAVAYFADIAALGVLSVGVALAEAIWLIPRSTALIQYVALVNAPDKQGQTYAALRGSRLTLLATVAAVLVLAAVPPAWLAAVFGPAFGAARPLILGLVPGIVLAGASMQASTYFAGVARYGVNNRATLIGLVITVAAALLLVPRLGSLGAVLGMSAAYAGSAGYLFWQFRRATGAGWADVLPGPGDVKWLWQRALLLKNLEAV